MIFAAILGVVTGHYVFREPIQKYWEEQQRQKQFKQSEERSEKQ